MDRKTAVAFLELLAGISDFCPSWYMFIQVSRPATDSRAEDFKAGGPENIFPGKSSRKANSTRKARKKPLKENQKPFL